jgi:S1-C subfamily serine protease
MRRVWVILLPLIIAGCVHSPPAATPQQPPSPTVSATPQATVDIGAKLLTEARGFVYRARSVDCLATGSSFETPYGIATNRHVASGSTVLQLSTWDGTDFNASVDSLSTGPDLALLSARHPADAPPIRTGRLPGGTPVWVAGYPKGNQLSVKAGVLLDYAPGARWGVPGKVMEISNPVQPGNSGSPLLDQHGDVVGVVYAVERATRDGLAIPASTLSHFATNPPLTRFGGCIEN